MMRARSRRASPRCWSERVCIAGSRRGLWYEHAGGFGGDMIDLIARAREAPLARPSPPATGDGGSPGQGGYTLPPDCPMRPLGLDGDIYHYLDLLAQLKGIPAKNTGA